MAKVDFWKIMIKDINGNDMTVDVHETMGNALYMNGKDIAECELGQAIYHQKEDEPLELDEKQMKIAREYAEGIKAFILRQGILDALEKG